MKAATPRLLESADGRSVAAGDWRARRAELRIIVEHEYGGMPPEPARTTPVLLCASRAGFCTYEVRCGLDTGGELSFLMNLWVPAGEGPFPVILNGDGCWRYFDDDIVARVLARGCAAASFNRTALAADNKESYRETGLYRAYPGASFGALAAWAWGYHRCVDALGALDFLRADQIAITGHSRGGKTVLLAGATDERIALTNPNDSGAGGSALNRLKGKGAERIDDFVRSGNIFWFGPGFAEYRHRDAALPYDQHFLHALVAPRALLVSEAYGDLWANPSGSYAACLAAREVYDLLGCRDAIGWAFREGAHGHTAQDFEALLDFVDVRFGGKAVLRGFQREVFCDFDGESGVGSGTDGGCGDHERRRAGAPQLVQPGLNARCPVSGSRTLQLIDARACPASPGASTARPRRKRKSPSGRMFCGMPVKP